MGLSDVAVRQLADWQFGPRGQKSAIETLLRGGFLGPSVALLYGAMDTVAALSRPPELREANRSTFVDWCDRYMRIAGAPDVRGIDLYGARCGVLHSSSAESSLSIKGEARPIIYRAGSGAPAKIEMVDRGFKSAHVVQIEHLAESYSVAFLETIRDVHLDERLSAAVETRLKKTLGFLPYSDLST